MGSYPQCSKRHPHNGFTLIELMIVVGIIGVLVSVAVPQFEQYQRKAKQSEAKLSLSAIYGLEKSFYAEYSAYIPAFDAIGYSPEGFKRNYQQKACETDVWSGTVTGYSGAATVSYYMEANVP